MASFLRHVTSMQSPTNPSYAATGRCPVPDVQFFRTEATLDNIAAHQTYLEKLQFEHNNFRSWSNMVQVQTAGETQHVHLQLMQMIQEVQNRNSPWAQAWAKRSTQLPPRPAQRTPQPPAVPIKPDPAVRAQAPTIIFEHEPCTNQCAFSSADGCRPMGKFQKVNQRLLRNSSMFARIQPQRKNRNILHKVSNLSSILVV